MIGDIDTLRAAEPHAGRSAPARDESLLEHQSVGTTRGFESVRAEQKCVGENEVSVPDA